MKNKTGEGTEMREISVHTYEKQHTKTSFKTKRTIGIIQ